MRAGVSRSDAATGGVAHALLKLLKRRRTACGQSNELQCSCAQSQLSALLFYLSTFIPKSINYKGGRRQAQPSAGSAGSERSRAAAHFFAADFSSAFFSSRPSAAASGGGTALPTWRCMLVTLP